MLLATLSLSMMMVMVGVEVKWQVTEVYMCSMMGTAESETLGTHTRARFRTCKEEVETPRSHTRHHQEGVQIPF